jgi:phosphohistidine phosphatase
MASGGMGKYCAVSELHLLRHASAAPKDTAGDRARPLDLAGRHAAEALAAWIAGRRLAPDLVLCSPALRTRQTLDLVAPAFTASARTVIEDELYLASAAQLLARLRRLDPAEESVLVVGHNPGLHELAATLSEVAAGPLVARLAQGFPAAALASFTPLVTWPGLDRRGARLVGFVTPKEVARGRG